ncbi:MAG: fumarate hydratase [Peptococcaceae bacterium]|nr:fumarate hydratase [Peptococcaceae bacterium]
MRELHKEEIILAVKEMCITINYQLSQDVLHAYQAACLKEESSLSREIMENLIKNADIARERDLPLCQDTGMVIVFVEIGQDLHIAGGDVTQAIQEGVRQGYREGYLRKSVVKDPLIRENTGDNTPAIIYYDIVPGEKLKIMLSAKGFGSENMSKTKMLKPSDGIRGVEDFVIESVIQAGPNPCPPIIVGVGIGGTLDKAAYLAKKALLRPIGKYNELQHIQEMEKRLLEKINNLGIGPQGLGGKTTAFGVQIEVFPTHIAGLPVAVNLNCHISRHTEKVL